MLRERLFVNTSCPIGALLPSLHGQLATINTIYTYLLSLLFASLFGYRFAYRVQKLAQHTQVYFLCRRSGCQAYGQPRLQCQGKLSGLQDYLHVIVRKNIQHAIAQPFRHGRINIGSYGLQPLPEIIVLHISIPGRMVLNSTSPLGPKV